MVRVSRSMLRLGFGFCRGFRGSDSRRRPLAPTPPSPLPGVERSLTTTAFADKCRGDLVYGEEVKRDERDTPET